VTESLEVVGLDRIEDVPDFEGLGPALQDVLDQRHHILIELVLLLRVEVHR
jgi:hypothetical protein